MVGGGGDRIDTCCKKKEGRCSRYPFCVCVKVGWGICCCISTFSLPKWQVQNICLFPTCPCPSVSVPKPSPLLLIRCLVEEIASPEDWLRRIHDHRAAHEWRNPTLKGSVLKKTFVNAFAAGSHYAGVGVHGKPAYRVATSLVVRIWD